MARTILITGSSRGIGEGIAREAQSQGYNVILHASSETDELLSVAKDLNAKYITCDVSKETEVQEAVDKLEKIDALVNCAGINPSKTLMNIDSETLERIYQVNVFGLMYMTKAVAKKMIAQGDGGSIVNIGSAKSYKGFAGKPIYASAKAAVDQFTAAMAKEFAPNNIRVNCVGPGFVNTALTAATMSPQIQAQIDGILLARMADVSEIAKPVMFLIGDGASYITGQRLYVDGGITIQKG